MDRKAVPLVAMRERIADGSFVQVVIWNVPAPVRGSNHHFKYSLALVVDETCVLRYDNEAGKGDHRHVGNAETSYQFSGLDQLQRDFVLEARSWLIENGRD